MPSVETLVNNSISNLVLMLTCLSQAKHFLLWFPPRPILSFFFLLISILSFSHIPPMCFRSLHFFTLFFTKIFFRFRDLLQLPLAFHGNKIGFWQSKSLLFMNVLLFIENLNLRLEISPANVWLLD